MIIDDVMTDKITLHGLGFVQIQLEGNQRLHVWHPELPRRACFKDSAIHDHRFDFVSRVLVGVQNNLEYRFNPSVGGGFMLYLHEGARTACGGRPWVPDGQGHMVEIDSYHISSGCTYDQKAYHFHRTEPGGDGKVATIMQKLGEHRKSTSESKWATMVMPLAETGIGVQDVTEFWSGQPFDLMLPTINGRTLEGNCDLCFLKGAKQVYSIIASDRPKAAWWARMESEVVSGGKFTGDGARFRFDRPSYQQMIDYSDTQFDMFADHDEAIACFCGD